MAFLRALVRRHSVALMTCLVAGCGGTSASRRLGGTENSGVGGAPDASDETACVVTDLERGPFTYTFDAETGRLTTRDFIYAVDVSAGTIATGGPATDPPNWYFTTTFDEHGNRIHEDSPGSVADWSNNYDGTRLVEVLETPVAGALYYPLARFEYAYDDPDHPDLWTRMDYDADADETVDSTCIRELEDGHPTTFDCVAPDDPRTLSTWRFTYENGRMVRADSDSSQWTGADGTPDIRYTWTYDDTGRLSGFQQDGTYHSDNPFIDGVPDLGETYAPGCAPLLDRFPWLAHLGVEDGANPQAQAPQRWIPR